MRVLRLLGWGVAAVAVPAWLTVVEVLWLPLRIGGVLVPLSVLVAVVGNLLLVRLAHRLSGSRLVGVLPALVWVLVSVRASIVRPEGDLLIAGGTQAANTVSLAFLLAGTVAGAFAVGQVLAGGGPVGVSGPAAGSGSGGAR